MRPWTPNFIAWKVKIDSMLVWIRFPTLGMEYYDENLLLAMVAVVRTPIKVDIRTIDTTKGRLICQGMCRD